ncbi:hypothetical protein Pcinc_043384 [Petrolisthes cinctipes]|uniref:Uncharacterized protein n=1 Tax=Petrolisthes cinctipes TaxID=88211 RepID=A0AAE1BFQ3_PETCI|nr:hypothetical protein Pcinc_043384 [Petrolisthes cinctipes]
MISPQPLTPHSPTLRLHLTSKPLTPLTQLHLITFPPAIPRPPLHFLTPHPPTLRPPLHLLTSQPPTSLPPLHILSTNTTSLFFLPLSLLLISPISRPPPPRFHPPLPPRPLSKDGGAWPVCESFVAGNETNNRPRIHI